jgi:hypothetical protein
MMIDDKLSVTLQMRFEFKPECVSSIVRFEASTALTLPILMFWDVRVCNEQLAYPHVSEKYIAFILTL